MDFELILFFLIFLFSFLLILRSLNLSVYVLIVLSTLLHKELFSFYRWDLLPVRAFMLALLCAGVVRGYFFVMRKIHEKRLSEIIVPLKDPFIFLLILSWVINGLSIIFSKNLQSSLSLFGFYTTVVVMGVFIYKYLGSNNEKVLNYLKFFIALIFFTCLFGYFQFFYYLETGILIGSLWNIPGNLSRIGALFWDVNHFASVLAALLPILGVFILLAKGWKWKLLNILLFIPILGVLFLTSSRSAWIMAFITFVSFVCILLVRKIGVKAIGLVLSIIVLVSIPFIIEYSDRASPFRAKIKQYLHYRMDSFDSHFMLLTGAMQVFEEYPILGGGYGSFFEQFSKTPIAPTYFGRDPAALNTRVPAHTIWGQTAAETGAAGLAILVLIFVLMLSSLLYIALTFRDKEKFLLSSAMASVIIGWFTAGIFYSYNSEFFYLIIFLFYAYAVSAFQSRNEEGKSRTFNIDEILNYFLKSQRFLGFILSVIAATLIFVSLGTNHLVPWDEAIYAKIAKNMAESGNYLVQSWKPGIVWYEKPPFYMWMTALAIKFIGNSSFAVRLPSAIFGFLTVMSVYLFAKKYFNKTAAFISAFALLTTVHFLYYARASMLDITATFFMTAGLFVYFNAKLSEKKLQYVISGLLIGFSVLTKGVVGLLPFGVIFFYEIYLLISKQQKISSAIISKAALMFLCAFIVYAPWHIYMYSQFGFLFLGNYFGYHVWDRAVMAIEDKGNPFYWYIIVMKVSMRLWFIALLGALPYSVYKYSHDFKERAENNKKLIFLLIWSLLIFIFFSAAQSKLVWYIIPIYPAVAILVGYFIERVLNFVMEKYSVLNNIIFKSLALYLIIVVGLTYLWMIKPLVYTSDLTGSQARLMILKDEKFKKDEVVYLDRIELPLAFYYTDGLFEIIDFRPDLGDRVPQVGYDQRLILLTKTGRYSDKVETKNYPPEIVMEDGDWILWYFDSEKEKDQDSLNKLREELTSTLFIANTTYDGIDNSPEILRDKYYKLLNDQERIITRINFNITQQ